MTRADVVAEARSWLGVPFRPKGRSRLGVDCIGLLVMIGTRFGVPHEDEQHYTDWPDPQRRMTRTLGRFLVQVGPADPWDGTIGAFTTHRALPGHVGVFSTKHGQRHLVHARMSERRVIEEPFDSDPRTRTMLIVARYRFPALED